MKTLGVIITIFLSLLGLGVLLLINCYRPDWLWLPICGIFAYQLGGYLKKFYTWFKSNIK